MKISFQTGMHSNSINFGLNRTKVNHYSAKKNSFSASNHDTFEKQTEVPSYNEFVVNGENKDGNNWINTETGTEITVKHRGEDTVLYAKYGERQPFYTSNFDEDCFDEDACYSAPQVQSKPKKQKILIITRDGLYYRVQEPDEKYMDEHKKFIKLDEKPQSFNLIDIENFLSRDNLKGHLVFHTNFPISPGHSEIDLQQGQNYLDEENNVVSSSMYKCGSKFPVERVVHQYPDNGASITDFTMGVAVELRQNKDETGMTIRKTVDNEEIYLTSEVKNNNVKIINEKTGKSFQVPLSFFADNSTHYSWEKSKYIPDEQREAKMFELFKKLSPTTILDLIKFKMDYPEANFPYLRADEGATYFKGISMPLKDFQETISHEALHYVTDAEGLLKPLQQIHDEEMLSDIGLIGFLSQYASDGFGKGYDRGLNELISIVGTSNIYGQEHGGRTEATRLAYPKTAKAIEEYLMKHYKNLISELIEKS